MMTTAPGMPASSRRPPEVAVDLAHLATHAGLDLLGELLHRPLALEALELLETLETATDRRVVGQRAADPTLGHDRHAAALGLTRDDVLDLTLRAHEEDLRTLGSHAHEEVAGPQQTLDGLAQVDDVDEVALAVDERAHLGVPVAGLMAEVNPRSTSC
jgi:hypothetical protein